MFLVAVAGISTLWIKIKRKFSASSLYDFYV